MIRPLLPVFPCLFLLTACGMKGPLEAPPGAVGSSLYDQWVRPANASPESSDTADSAKDPAQNNAANGDLTP
ncbi:MAG: lipoprotein [Zoogloeaceae bacterium]|nr:lipoprotein [Zoogloeaceae bacterium]